jgi:hypothetical protein
MLSTSGIKAIAISMFLADNSVVNPSLNVILKFFKYRFIKAVAH